MSDEQSPARNLIAEHDTRKRSKKGTRTWASDRFGAALLQLDIENYLRDGLELVRNRRIVDVMISPGKISAKIFTEQPRPNRIELRLPTYTPDEWDKILAVLSQKSLFLAKLLAGIMPLELERAVQDAGLELFPRTGEELSVQSDCGSEELTKTYLAALSFKISDRFESDPFTIFTLRGYGREETIVALRRMRSELARSRTRSSVPTVEPEQVTDPVTSLASTVENFWQYRAPVDQLSYTIVADELPAALLKRLDTIPVGNRIEYDVEQALEEAYAQVTRRAQAFGLGLRNL